MWKNKAGYACLAVSVAVMLFFFGKTYLLWVLFGLIALVTVTTFLIRTDAKKIKVQIKVRDGGQEGKDYKLGVLMEGIARLRVTGYILMELEVYNQMFERTQRMRYLIPLSDKRSEYTVKMKAPYCGEVKFICSGIWAVDYFHLFRIPIEKFREERMLIYPRNAKLDVKLSREAIGAVREDVNMQSREGNDPSEMYAVREYIPGDDIRAVHWKLSSKLDQLLLKQASDPTHYNVVLLPDFARKYQEKAAEEELEAIRQINHAVAIGAAIGEQLLKKRESFCIALPTGYGLKVLEVQNERQLKIAMAQWLSTSIPKREGVGLRYFSMLHLEQHFSRLVILSAGEYENNLNGLEKRIGVTIVSAVKGDKVIREHAQKIRGITEILMDIDQEKTYQIIC